MRILLDKGAKVPTRAFPTDAGLDFYSMRDGTVPAHGSATFGTGVHVELPKGTAGIILPRSGLMVKRDLLTFGVIDESYRGEIMVHMMNHSDEEYRVYAGDKISQMLIVPVLYEDVEVVDVLAEGERGENGFGSTGV